MTVFKGMRYLFLGCPLPIFVLKEYSNQVHSINLHLYTILVVPSNSAQSSLINNLL